MNTATVPGWASAISINQLVELPSCLQSSVSPPVFYYLFGSPPRASSSWGSKSWPLFSLSLKSFPVCYPPVVVVISVGMDVVVVVDNVTLWV